MKTNNTNYVMISEQELKLKKEEIKFSPTDLQELLEYKDVFIKFLKISWRRKQLSLCEASNRTNTEKIWNQMEVIQEIIKSIESSQDTYTRYVNDLEKKKEDKQE